MMRKRYRTEDEMRRQQQSDRSAPWTSGFLRACALAAVLSFLLAAAPTARGGTGEYDGDFHVFMYNRLVEMLNERCLAAGAETLTNRLLSIAQQDSVTQSNLNLLRATITNLWDWRPDIDWDWGYSSQRCYIVTDTNSYANDEPWYTNAFAALHTVVLTNGFTRVPANWTTNGVAIYSDDFTDVPVLWIHFQEIHEAVTSMVCNAGTYWRDEGNIILRGVGRTGQGITNTWEAATNAAMAGFNGPGSTNYDSGLAVAWTSGDTNFWYPDYMAWIHRECGTLTVTNLYTNASHAVSFYYHVVPFSGPNASFDANGDGIVTGKWTCWDAEDPSHDIAVTSTNLGNPDLPAPAWCVGPDGDKGYYIDMWYDAAAVIEWSGFTNFDIADPAKCDWEQDALVETGCECTGCDLELKIGYESSKSAAVRTKYELGTSSGLTNGGVRVKAYISEYKLDGDLRQMYSLDTRVITNVSNAAEGWEFVTVKRPSGAEVTFGLKGKDAGKPDNGLSYHMETNGADYEIHFAGEQNVVHRFNNVAAGGGIKEVRVGTKPPVNGSATTWPGMKTYVDGGGQIESNACATVNAVLEYSGDFVTKVVYQDEQENELHTLVVSEEDGDRVWVLNSENAERRRVVETNDTVQIWYEVDDGESIYVAKKEIRAESYDPDAGIITLTQTDILDPDGTPTSNVTVTVVRTFPWGHETIAVTNGVGSADPLVTTYSYYDDLATDGPTNYTRLKLQVDSDGSWVRYDGYDEEGRATNVLSTFNSAGPDSTAAQCRAVYTYYAGKVPSGKAFPTETGAATNDWRPRLVIEKVLGEEVARTYYAYFADSNVTKRCVTPDAAYDASDNLATVTHLYSSGTHDGRPQKTEHPDGTITTYAYSYDSGDDELTTTVDNGAESGGSVNDGVRTVTVQNGAGHVLSSTVSDIATTITKSSTSYIRNAWGQPLSITDDLSGLYATNVYGCCGLAHSRDNEGIWTTNEYTDLKQIWKVHRLGVTTTYGYDVQGNVVSVERAAGGVTATSTSTYDDAGRLRAQTNELGYGTAYAYTTNASGERVVTTTYPDGTTRIETTYLDGRTKHIGGTAVHTNSFSYGVATNSLFTIQYQGEDGADAWVKSYVDLLGRTERVHYPDGYEQGTVYNASGQAVASGDGISTNLTAYDSRGRPFQTAVDMDGNGAIQSNSTDRITETASTCASFDSKYTEQTVTYVYPTNTPFEIGRNIRAFDGSAIWSIAFGRTNHTAIVHDPDNAARTETLTHPDGTQTISAYTNGLLGVRTRKDSGGGTISTVSYAYDPFNRLATVVETAASGDTRTTSYSRDKLGRATNVTVSAGAISQTTSHEFDSMGRRTKTVLPDGEEVEYEYADTGELVSQDGARVYPVTYTYDSVGRIETMSTHRDTMWSDPYTTTWTYDSQRGWMTSKIHADATTNSFEYFDNGRLKKRSWVRGITTEYEYDLGGALTNVDYSDSTADISYVRDRLGRAVRVTDAIGTWTNTWCDDGQLDQVSLPQLAGGVLDLAHDAAGRRTNTALRIAGTTVHDSVYGFDTAGRLSTASDGAQTATYTYGPDGATWTNLSLGGPLNIGRTFDGLNRLTSIVNTPSNDTAATFSYTYNAADQRTTNTLADGSYWVYTYDAVGQVSSARKHFADGMRMPWAQFQYDFDTAGNRKTAACTDKDADSEQEYSLNDVNAYTSRTVPGKVIAAGTADSSAVVTVGDGTNTAALANRHGEYFWHVLDGDNSGGVFSTTNLQVRAFVQTATNSPVRTEVREALLPQTAESFTFDADGNQTASGLWTNTFNAENRLIQVESRSGVPDDQKVRIDYVYDHQGRMTTRTLRSGYAGGAYATTNVTTYVWDGFNILAEITDAGETNLNLWGLDLSGSLQGAGGVGGLIAVSTEDGETFLPTYDGNGNICQYIAEDGTVVADREYSPFGVTIALTGEKKDDFTHWWSTKPLDPDTGLSIYEFRAYSAELGRWLCRDLTGEEGGPNLYGYVLNSPIILVDDLGAAVFDHTVGRGQTLSHIYRDLVREGRIDPSVLSAEAFYSGVERLNPGLNRHVIRAGQSIRLATSRVCCLDGEIIDAEMLLTQISEQGRRTMHMLNLIGNWCGGSPEGNAARNAAVDTLQGLLTSGGTGSTLGSMGVGMVQIANQLNPQGALAALKISDPNALRVAGNRLTMFGVGINAAQLGIGIVQVARGQAGATAITEPAANLGITGVVWLGTHSAANVSAGFAASLGPVTATAVGVTYIGLAIHKEFAVDRPARRYQAEADANCRIWSSCYQKTAQEYQRLDEIYRNCNAQ